MLKRFSLASLLIVIAVMAVGCWLFTTFHPLGPVYAWFLFAATIFCVGVRVQRTAIVFVSVLMMLVGLLGFPILWMSGHPISMERLSRIDVGTRAEVVERLLGVPTKVRSSDLGDSWVYSGDTFCYITIEFAADGTVRDVVHDH